MLSEEDVQNVVEKFNINNTFVSCRLCYVVKDVFMFSPVHAVLDPAFNSIRLTYIQKNKRFGRLNKLNASVLCVLVI